MAMPPVFEKTLVRAGEVRSFRIDCQLSSASWETLEQANQRIAHSQTHSDWHGVERDVARFTREIAELRLQGWREVSKKSEV
jgi:hypothetical protein